MTDGITNLTIELISRPAPKRGPTSSEAYNDLQNEAIASFIGVANQWNNELVPLLAGLPNGTNDLDPWVNGLDGTGIYTDKSATSTDVNQTYWNSVRNRPNSIREQFDNVYAGFITLGDQLQVDIAAAIADSGGLAPTGVVPGSYTTANLTVNQFGQITAASNGSGASYTAGNGLTLTGSSFSINESYSNSWTTNQTFTLVTAQQVTNPPVAVSLSSHAGTVNWATSAIQTVSLSGGSQATTLSYSGAVAGQTLMLIITDTSTSDTVVFPTQKYAGGSQATQTSGGTDIWSIYYDGTHYWATVSQAFA